MPAERPGAFRGGPGVRGSTWRGPPTARAADLMGAARGGPGVPRGRRGHRRAPYDAVRDVAGTHPVDRAPPAESSTHYILRCVVHTTTGGRGLSRTGRQVSFGGPPGRSRPSLLGRRGAGRAPRGAPRRNRGFSESAGKPPRNDRPGSGAFLDRIR